MKGNISKLLTRRGKNRNIQVDFAGLSFIRFFPETKNE